MHYHSHKHNSIKQEILWRGKPQLRPRLARLQDFPNIKRLRSRYTVQVTAVVKTAISLFSIVQKGQPYATLRTSRQLAHGHSFLSGLQIICFWPWLSMAPHWHEPWTWYKLAKRNSRWRKNWACVLMHHGSKYCMDYAKASGLLRKTEQWISVQSGCKYSPWFQREWLHNFRSHRDEGLAWVVTMRFSILLDRSIVDSL